MNHCTRRRISRLALMAVTCLVLLSTSHLVRAADCNSNGIDDTIEIAGATSSDCNSNGVPDGCEIQTTFPIHRPLTTDASEAFYVVAADFDGDGDDDVLSASRSDDTIAWYENIDGLGTFGVQQIITTAADGARSVFAQDLDLDGDMDVLSASANDNKIAWYENIDGLGGFGPQMVISTDLSFAKSVYSADLDGDGDQDVLSASTNDNKIAWYKNLDGLGSFGPQQVLAASPIGPHSIVAADIDGDGDPDILSGAASMVAWHENSDGLGTFGPVQTISTSVANAHSVFAHDIDGDGDLDALSASFDNKIAWYENLDGLGNFGSQQIITTAINTGSSVFAADMDNDGDADVVSASQLDSKIAWYANIDGLGQFGPQQVLKDSPSFPISIFAADLNGDGSIDILSASLGDNEIAWYENIRSNDCNHNGTHDSCDVICDTSTDCNYNLIPDECELDCNLNNVPDDCDVNDESSDDCNTNGIPDECELDCNLNNVPDDCDVDDEFSDDCNSNGIPDECELDCNLNNTPDDCDIANELSDDCNFNGIPDECELGNNDCNDNSVPDECDWDCNNNNIPDDCDIAGLTSSDCNNNGVVDDCDVSASQVAKLTATDAAAGDLFGNTVAISGNTVVIGAPRHDGNENNSGSVYVFRDLEGTWEQIAKLVSDDAGANDSFGRGIAISEDTIIVGAYLHDNGTISDTGAAYVFREIGDEWQQIAKLTISDATQGDHFAQSVALSGNTAVIGSDNDNDDGRDSGSSYIFREIGGSWQQVAKLTANDASAGDNFGYSVAIEENTLVVGAFEDDEGGTNSGSAYVFREDKGTWQQIAKLTADDAVPYNNFGYDVAISADTIIIGARGAHTSLTGSSYIYREIDGVWQQIATLAASDAEPNDKFGASVSISADTVVIGAERDTHNSISSGSSYVFREVNGVWHQISKVTPGDPGFLDLFGFSSAMSGDTAIIGAEWNDDDGSNSGSTYVISIPRSDCNLNGVPDDCELDNDEDGLIDDCDPCAGGLASGDSDANGVINLDDFANLEACLAGPGGGLGVGCECFDFDSDGDNDLYDFAAFIASY